MIPVREFTSPADMLAHYRAVRARLGIDTPRPVVARLPVRVPVETPVRIEIAVSPPEAEPEEKFVPEPGKPGARRIVAHIARQHGLTPEDIYGPRKGRAVVDARFAAIALVARTNPGWSLPQIGRVFNRDHTTILNALRQVEQRQ